MGEQGRYGHFTMEGLIIYRVQCSCFCRPPYQDQDQDLSLPPSLSPPFHHLILVSSVSFSLDGLNLSFPCAPMEEDDQKELQLLPTPQSIIAPSSSSSSSGLGHQLSMNKPHRPDHYAYEAAAPSLDLQLSISLRPIHHPPNTDEGLVAGPGHEYGTPETASVKALKWHAAEQIRLAAIEKAYAERVRELTRREMELAQSEFTRARNMWERAREEVEKAEKMKDRATRRIDSTCMEITCQSCRQRFRPA